MADENGETVQTPAEVIESTPVEQTEKLAFDRTALESKVASGLAALTAAPSDEDDEAAVEDATDVEEVETDADKTGEDANDKEAVVEEKKPAAKSAAGESDAPTLPAPFRRSLEARGWSPEDIDHDLAKFGMDFVALAERTHRGRNAEITEWAQAGRTARQQQIEKGKEATTTETGLQTLQPIDPKPLKEQYGDDKLVDAILNPVNAVIAQINRIVPIIQQTQQSSQHAHLETLGREIEGFFGGKDMEAYKEMYGTASGEMSEAHKQSRNKVLETADALIAGARMQNRNLSFKDALLLAHDSISGGFKEQAVRSALTKTMTTRAKGLSLKPSGKKAAVVAKPGDRSSLEKATSKRLAAVFAN